MTQRSIGEELTINYILILGILAFVTLVNFLILHKVIDNQDSDALEINIAGRQRMLSQQLAMYALQLNGIEQQEEQLKTKAKINKISSIMLNTHEDLVESRLKTNTSSTLSPKFQALYFGPKQYVDKHVRQYLALIKQLIQLDNYNNPQSNHLAKEILQQAESLVPQLNAVVMTHQEANAKNVNQLQESQAYTLLIAIIAVLLTAVFIFRPMVIRITVDAERSKRQEEQLRRTQKMEALENLTGGVAHDFNNILGIIRGYSDILHKKVCHDKKLDKYAREINKAVERGTKITRKLLAFSRKAPSDEDSQAVDINTIIKDDQQLLEKTLTSRITLHIELCESPATAFISKHELQDTILNLCINASHAIPESGELKILTRKLNISENSARELNIEKGDYTVLSITDTGTGMSTETMSRIFEPFYSTKGDKGTGLGLSQVYGFMHSSKGTITVNSESGQGTEFCLYFPLYEQQEEISLDLDLSRTSNHQGHETILVVDDDDQLRNLAKEILSSCGYHIITAINGEDALNILAKMSVDLVFSDIIMPKMDGFQLAAEVTARYPDIKIQLTSGFIDDKHQYMVNKKLSKDVLHKPYSEEILLTTIRERLSREVLL